METGDVQWKLETARAIACAKGLRQGRAGLV